MLASLKTLLRSIVDYAGLYPPAQLDLRSAMQTYAQSIASSDTWMLSHFVLPAAKLEEFSALVPEMDLSQWSLSVVVKNLEEVEQTFTLTADSIKIAALEFKPRSPDEIRSLIPELPSDIDTFFEISLDRSWMESIAVLQGTSASAKVRTGGVTEAAFPSTKQLAEWICACAQAKVPFKATAGLHHPFPGTYPLTYESNHPDARMHGFLNVAIAAAFAYRQVIDLENVIALLEINSAKDCFQFEDDQLIWNSKQKEYRLDLNQIQTARQHFFRSFGSCSFQEPIDDLRTLNLLNKAE
jgi:hypothetical protein